MKKIYTSWSLELLADKLIEKIIEKWTNPFCSPALVFTDAKTEQWFKLHWLKNEKHGKSVLMNLKTMRLQPFLFNLIAPVETALASVARAAGSVPVAGSLPGPAAASGEVASLQIEKLSVELLRDTIIEKLVSKETGAEGKFYYETLGSEEIIKYLTSSSPDKEETKGINAAHLYDFAQTAASLFMDYEDTRPDSLLSLLEKEPWQKKLYQDVITEWGIIRDGKAYMSLYQLTQLNKKLNEQKGQKGHSGLTFNWPADRTVFIFGFLGLGQLYRSLLSDFSLSNSLEVFLQTSELVEKPENELLKAWHSYAKENLELWTKDTEVLALSDSTSFTAEDSLLHKTQKSIAENKKIIPLPFQAEDRSLTLTAAPNRIRETEAVHSRICQLLSDGKNQLADILVVAPHIQDYKTAIEQVFDQNDRFSSDSAFPYIPYIIADYSGERSLTAEALNILSGILIKGYLSRSDVFALLHNYLVKSVRAFSDDEISDWSDWTSQLNVYRDREGKEDWQKAKNRLLLSRLTTDLVTDSETNERQFLPFESMTTSDNTSLYKFIQFIDELEKWTNFSQKKILSPDDIDKLRSMLEGWLLLGDNAAEDLYNESLVFQNIVEEIERQKLTSSNLIFTEAFFSALLDRSHAVTLHNTSSFSQGITFANFEANRILTAKYIFFMGLDSKVFPGIDRHNELDLREEEAGDDKIPLRNKNAFLCQLMAARDGLFISYVNKNLQKDEDFFQSSVLKTLFESIYAKVQKEDGDKPDYPDYEIRINIDETRDWSELYTQREFRNKNNFISLQQTGVSGKSTKDLQEAWQDENQSEEDSSYETQNGNTPDRVKLYQMKSYLKEPFIFLAEQMFNSSEDNSAENEAQEFEPLFYDKATSAALRKEVVLALVKEDYDKAQLMTHLDNLNLLPDSYFGRLAIDSIESAAKQIIDEIQATIPQAKDFNYEDSQTVFLKKQNDVTEKDWYLSGELAWHNTDFESTKEIITLELNNSENYFSGYISSLVLLAKLPEDFDTETFNVTMNVVSYTNNTAKNKALTFLANPLLARNILSRIYRAMFIEQNQIKSAPYEFIKKETEKGQEEPPLTFSEFIKDLDSSNPFSHSPWSYFSKKDAFDKKKDLGYTENDFVTLWPLEVEKQKSLILFLNNASQAGE